MPATEPWPVADLGGFLRGRWRLERELIDRLADTCGRFVGLALFRPAPEGLRYRERGRLRWQDRDCYGTRRYYYRLTAPDQAQVEFADGRPFHALDLRTGQWRCQHRCGADRYQGEFTVHRRDAWQMVWQVDGPRKRLLLRSWFERV